MPEEPKSEIAREPADPPIAAPLGQATYTARAIHLFALAGFAVVQPLFSVLGSEPDFWIARDASYFDVIVLVATWVLLVPGMVFLIEWLIGWVSTTASWIVHVVMVGMFVSLIAVEVVDSITSGALRGLIVLAAGVAVGLVFALAYVSVKWVRELAGVLAIGPLVFVSILVLSLPPLGGTDVDPIDVGISSEASVVVLVLDEFQLAAVLEEVDVIDDTRFPSLARLAGLSTWYPYSTTVHDNTAKSVPAILSGLYPSNTKTATAVDYPVNLFTALAATHRMRVSETATQLCPTSVCVGDRDTESIVEHLVTLGTDTAIVYLHAASPDSLRYRLPPIGTRWEGFLRSDGTSVSSVVDGMERGKIEEEMANLTGDEPRALEFGAFLDSFDPALGPTLYYLHVDLPHAPWSMTPSGKRYPFSDVIPNYFPNGDWGSDEVYVEQGFLRYVSQISFVDSLVGRTIDRLKSVGMFESSMVVVVSDHGQNFAPGEARRAFTDETIAAIAGVPLFVKYPYQDLSEIDRSNVQTIDVFPTVVEALGGEIMGLDGRSLITGRAPDSKRMISNAGGDFRLDSAEFASAAAVHRVKIARMFAPGHGFDEAFHSAGIYPHLNGSVVTELRILDSNGQTEIEIDELVQEFDPGGPIDPVGVPISVQTDSELPASFAVAVNGTIVTTVTAYRVDGDTASLYAYLPPESFRSGANRIDVFGIAAGSGGVGLIRFS